MGAASLLDTVAGYMQKSGVQRSCPSFAAGPQYIGVVSKLLWR